MKAKLLPSSSSDAGKYNLMQNVHYGEIVSCEYANAKHNAILIPHSEMMRVGADFKNVHTDGKYLWGDFEIVEED